MNFHARIESLYPGHIDEESNPLDPEPLVRLFVSASKGIGLDIKAHIILLKTVRTFCH